MELNDNTIKDLQLKSGDYIYFIGIGGSSMSGLAELSIGRGYKVAGTDTGSSPATERLISLGAHINLGHNEKNITEDINLVVYTVAISQENEELVKAKRLGIPIIERGLFLAYISSNFDMTIAICGVHGKTTTTTMTASCLKSGGLNPSVHVGGVIPKYDSNVVVGGSKYFVTEACEYHNNFLRLSPKYGILLNVEPEHLDFFKNIENMVKSFSEFASKIPEDGLLVVCSDSKFALEAAKSAKSNVITYSTKQKYAPKDFFNAKGNPPIRHIYAESPSMQEQSSERPFEGYKYIVEIDGKEITEIKLHVPGIHNVSNSLAVFGLANHLGCSNESIVNGFLDFTGAKRRFELVKTTEKGAYIISDYAHHPSEIKEVLKATKGIAKNKVIAVFQPHTFSRAMTFKEGFRDSLKLADRVIITDIYAAREPDTGIINSKMMNDFFVEGGINSDYISDFHKIADTIRTTAGNGDIVLLLGAGTVNLISNFI